MTQHYTRNTLEDTAWCNKCGRFTQHQVSGHRRGRCLEHQAQELTQAQQRRREKAERDRPQLKLLQILDQEKP